MHALIAALGSIPDSIQSSEYYQEGALSTVQEIDSSSERCWIWLHNKQQKSKKSVENK